MDNKFGVSALHLMWVLGLPYPGFQIVSKIDCWRISVKSSQILPDLPRAFNILCFAHDFCMWSPVLPFVQ